MTLLADILSALTPWLLGLALIGALFILLLRCVAEPFAPGIAFGSLVRRLVDRRALEPNGPVTEEFSVAGRQLRRRLRRNEWALHAQAKLIVWILCVMLLSRLLILASAMVGSVLTGSLDKLFTAAISHWVRSDAADYIELARHGYDMAEAPELIAFLPLYPMAVKLVAYLCFGHYVFAGFLVSNVCLMGAGWALYHIVNGLYGERSARRAVLLMMFAPLSLVFSVPYAESMFLMFTLLSVLCARNRSFLLAALFGALSCFTRLIGALVIVPILMEAFKYLHALDLRRRHRNRFIRYLVMYTLMSFLPLAGTVAYLVVNKLVAGKLFAFMDVLSDSWFQNVGSIFATMGYTARNAVEYGDLSWRLGTWIPQAAFMLAAAVTLLVMSTRVEPADGLYAWLYLFLTLMPTWVLSGPRTITAMYPMYVMLSVISRKKRSYIAIMAVFVALLCFFSYTYALMGSVV